MNLIRLRITYNNILILTISAKHTYTKIEIHRSNWYYHYKSQENRVLTRRMIRTFNTPFFRYGPLDHLWKRIKNE